MSEQSVGLKCTAEGDINISLGMEYARSFKKSEKFLEEPKYASMLLVEYPESFESRNLTKSEQAALEPEPESEQEESTEESTENESS